MTTSREKLSTNCSFAAEAEILRAERLDAEAAERAEQDRLDRAARWTVYLCPRAFQRTDRKRLAEVSRGASEAVLAWEPGPRGLLLLGPSGTGKTRSAWKLLERLHADGQNVVGMTAFGFSVEASRRAMDGTFGAWIDHLRAVDVVLLDDLGKESLTEHRAGALFGLLDERFADERPVIVTTNFSGAELAPKLGERGKPLVRRLREFCQIVDFPGKGASR